jgi:hypothetical protein
MFGIPMSDCVASIIRCLRRRAIAILLSGVVASPLMAVGQDWENCSSDLDTLRRRASDASSTASETAEKYAKAKEAEEELRNCLQYPEVHDLMRDRCRSLRNDFESARSDYRNQLEDLRSSLDDVDSKIRRSSSSCGYDLSRVAGPPPAVPSGVQNREVCAVWLRYKGRAPIATLVDACSKNMPVEQCRICLASP